MSQASVTIHAVAAGMTAEQVKQKLSGLYNVPEEKFEAACQSLLVENQPYVLIPKIDPVQAEAHEKRLAKLGFICHEEESFAADESGLSLTPVDAVGATATVAECPACDKPSGGGEVCDNCGVVISKFLEHKTFDDQLKSQLQSSAYSEERVAEARKEKEARDKKVENAKKLNKVASKKASSANKDDSSEAAPVDKQVSVDADKKTSKKLYAIVASVGLAIVGTGVIAYKFVDQPASQDELLSEADTNNTAASINTSTDVAFVDAINVENESEDSLEIVPETAFDFQNIHQRELINIEKRIGMLYEDDMVFSITNLIFSKADPREKIYANQALAKLEEYSDETAGKLEEINAKLGDLDSNLDRVQMLLNQAGLYSQFEFPKKSDETLEQAKRISSDIDVSEDQIMATVAFAEFQSFYGNMEDAMAGYQQAKDQSSTLKPQSLVDSAYAFIAISEASHGLSKQALSTGELIATETTLENTQRQIEEIFVITGASAALESADSPDLGAAKNSSKTGDSQIDDLIEMTEQNKKTLKAASGLVGQ